MQLERERERERDLGRGGLMAFARTPTEKNNRRQNFPFLHTTHFNQRDKNLFAQKFIG